ncbi:MAG: asparaginase [Gammaproteobacteria bacterium]|nr:asparaginase [Gammaproteobacteria bacterium]
MQPANPILVEVTRGPAVESVHRGSAVIVDRRGRVVRFWGDMNQAIFPRSAVKSLQAIPLVRTGAARALDLSPEEIAMACASHGGEPVHTATVSEWLGRIGLGPRDLECGAHPPTDSDARLGLAGLGQAPSPLHNNCSGKHAGFLSVCRHLGFPARGYTRADHPVQELVRDTLEEFTGCPLRDAARGVDGCGIPVFGIPLRALATAMMKFSAPEQLDEPTAEAVRTIRGAMTGHPYLVAGRDQFCTLVMDALAPDVVVKTGAEGTCCAAILNQGLGIAIKIDDGAARASEVAAGAILRFMEAMDDSHYAALRSTLEPDVLNAAGLKVGVIRASATLTQD